MNIVRSAEDLVTSLEQTRAGFISFALEKNRMSTPLIERAKVFKVLASSARTAKDLLSVAEIRPAMLTAAGVSDKALNYFSEEDKNGAILNLIEKFLEPAGEYFIDELVYRYLLIKGDSLGGTMRNLVGTMAQQKLIRTLLSNLAISEKDYRWLNKNTNRWENGRENDYDIERMFKAMSWTNQHGKERVLAFNLKIPLVDKNIDLCLFESGANEYDQKAAVSAPGKIVMLGELKGGIDPAGADEHWKTGNSALNRIRDAFTKSNIKTETSFIAAAIEKNMAGEIFEQLRTGKLSYAANLTIGEQLTNYCNWLLQL